MIRFSGWRSNEASAAGRPALAPPRIPSRLGIVVSDGSVRALAEGRRAVSIRYAIHPRVFQGTVLDEGGSCICDIVPRIIVGPTSSGSRRRREDFAGDRNGHAVGNLDSAPSAGNTLEEPKRSTAARTSVSRSDRPHGTVRRSEYRDRLPAVLADAGCFLPSRCHTSGERETVYKRTRISDKTSAVFPRL